MPSNLMSAEDLLGLYDKAISLYEGLQRNDLSISLRGTTASSVLDEYALDVIDCARSHLREEIFARLSAPSA